MSYIMNVIFSRTTFLLLCFAGSTWRREVHSWWGERGGEGTQRQRVNVKTAGTAVFNAT